MDQVAIGRVVLTAASTSSRSNRAELAAHRALDEAKRELGGRGPAWWKDGAPSAHGEEHALSPVVCPSCPIAPRRMFNAQSLNSGDGPLIDSIDLHVLAPKRWRSSATTAASNRLAARSARVETSSSQSFSEEEQRDHGEEMEEWRGNRFKAAYLPLCAPRSRQVPDLYAGLATPT